MFFLFQIYLKNFSFWYNKWFCIGECSKDEFYKTVAKIGISGFTEKNLAEVFDSYDLNSNGSLDYKEFVGGLYGNTSIAKKGDEEKKPAGRRYNENSKFAYLDQEE